MRHLRLIVGAVAGSVLIGGAAFVWLGVYNVSARNGHWPGVSLVLHTAFKQSVRRRAPAASNVPSNIDDDALAMLGAGHYEQACRQCHGAPEAPAAVTVQQMSPRPPPIIEAVGSWKPAQLFWIVREGVKMSGMPAWPSARRADDVWAVVAFLQRVPELDADGYQRLLTQQPSTREASVAVSNKGRTEGIESCVNCHGEQGRSHGNRHVPRLDLQNASYLGDSLLAYRSGERYSGIMQQAASVLSDDAIERLARHYATKVDGASQPSESVSPEQAVERSPGTTNPESSPTTEAARKVLIDQGQKLASAQESSRDVPACEACHGPWPEPLSADFPAIAGQHEGFLRTQLMSWKEGTRGGTELSKLMHEVVPDLSADDMRALAAYYTSLPLKP